MVRKKKIINNQIFVASVLNFFGTFLLKAITHVSIPIFTRIMTPTDYGYVSTYTTYISFLSIVIGLSLNTATANARIDFEKRFDDYNSSIIKASFVVFIIEIVVGNILCGHLESILSINRLYLNIIFFIAYGEYVVNTFYKINTIDFRFESNLKVSLSNALISLLISIILILTLENAVIAKLIGQGSFLLIAAIIIFIKIAFIRSKNFDWADVQYAKKIAAPNIFHQVSQLIMSQSDRVIILNMCGPVVTAKYSVIYSFGLIMQMVWNAVNEVWVPWLYRQLHGQKISQIKKMSKIYLYLFTLVSVVVMLIAPDFMPILAPESYADAKDMIIVVLLATYFIFLYSFFANIEIFYKKNKYMAMFTIIAAIMNIIGNYVLIPIFGYKAAAYTTLFSYILLMVLHYSCLTYLFKLNVYSIKIFIPPIFIMVGTSVITLMALNLPLIRYTIVLVILTIGCVWIHIKRKVVLDFIDYIRK